MGNYHSKWNRLFYFFLGLFIAGSFSMKWIENDLVYNGDKISIFGLELFYKPEKIMLIFSGIDDKVKTILGYHLSFDFVFMAGCYPGIACLCMMAGEKVKNKNAKIFLRLLACFPLLAWAFDVVENYYLLKWLATPVIGPEFGFYHAVVYSKWILALSGFFFAAGWLLIIYLKKKTRHPKSAI
jgi:hypothetical protein